MQAATYDRERKRQTKGDHVHGSEIQAKSTGAKVLDTTYVPLFVAEDQQNYIEVPISALELQ